MDHKEITYQNRELLTEEELVVRLFPMQPVIIYSTKGYHVLLELNTDQSIYVYMANGEILKIPAEAITDQIVDVNDYLQEDSTALDDSKVPERYKQVFHLLTEEQRIYVIKQHRDHQLTMPKPLDDHKPTIKFINFDIPTATIIKCWYHPTHSWKIRKQSIYYCQGFTGNVYVALPELSKTSHLIWEPQKYSSIQAKHFYDYKLIVQKEGWEKPTTELVTKLVTLHQMANNLPDYRCRLDIENKQSHFWTDRPISQRILEMSQAPLFHMPPAGITLTEAAIMLEERDIHLIDMMMMPKAYHFCMKSKMQMELQTFYSQNTLCRKCHGQQSRKNKPETEDTFFKLINHSSLYSKTVRNLTNMQLGYHTSTQNSF
jgi:hypothetical protein